MVILSFLASVLWVAMLVGFIVAVFWVIFAVVLIRGFKRWAHGHDEIKPEAED
jgi:type III secretory pathway component EscU